MSDEAVDGFEIRISAQVIVEALDLWVKREMGERFRVSEVGSVARSNNVVPGIEDRVFAAKIKMKDREVVTTMEAANG